MSRLVGINGYSRSGKDAAAVTLVQAGFTRIAFADVLRDIAYAIDPLVHTFDWLPPFDTKEPFEVAITERLSAVIDREGWDRAKNDYPDVRRLLQRLGTEAGREILGENIWVDIAFARAGDTDIVVTDMRFPNEADAVTDRGGTTVRINRPGVGPRNDHPSETSLNDYDFDIVIENDGTLEDLDDKVRKALL